MLVKVFNASTSGVCIVFSAIFAFAGDAEQVPAKTKEETNFLSPWIAPREIFDLHPAESKVEKIFLLT